jgi:multicomponent Na+:H+ antiporter subunit D
MAAVLVGIESFAPRRIIDIASIITSTTLVGMCTSLVIRSINGPIVYWFGGRQPFNCIALGIGFTIDPIGAGLATFSAFLTTAALIYSWRYFDVVGSLFHS